MNTSDILQLRLLNNGLINPSFKDPTQVVSHLGAVQAQDFTAAKWALKLRTKNATHETIEAAFNEGKLLRTHVMRPTWHFVMPEDIRWMQELTAPQIKKRLAPYDRKLELTGALLAKSNTAMMNALRDNNYLMRQELKKLLERIGIKTDVQRLAHIIMWAELDGLICSGPRKGKQFTYALLEERAPKEKKLPREEALAKLALKYFTSHGPAQLKDFSWWSGLTAKDSEKALLSIKSKLFSDIIDNKTYWFATTPKIAKHVSPFAYLLSVYDEYFIGYKDRSAIVDEKYSKRMPAVGNFLLGSLIIINGEVTGTWKKVSKKSKVEIILTPFRKLRKGEREALQSEVARYRMFLGNSVDE